MLPEFCEQQMDVFERLKNDFSTKLFKHQENIFAPKRKTFVFGEEKQRSQVWNSKSFLSPLRILDEISVMINVAEHLKVCKQHLVPAGQWKLCRSVRSVSLSDITPTYLEAIIREIRRRSGHFKLKIASTSRVL